MCLKMLEKELKTTASLFSVTSKIFVNHVNNNIILIISKNMVLFLIFMASGLIIQLQIF